MGAAERISATPRLTYATSRISFGRVLVRCLACSATMIARPQQVNAHEAELKMHGKMHQFCFYDGAGRGIFYWHRPLYGPEQGMDGWSKVFAFFGEHLAK
jgi:hypothetical protein